MLLIAVALSFLSLFRSDAAITLKKSNFAAGTLDGGISNTATSATLVDGARFPQAGTFRAVIWGANYSAPELDAGAEIVNATLSSGSTFNLMRGLEDTSARAWATGDNFALTVTKGVLDEYEAAIAAVDPSHVHNSVYYTKPELDGGVLNTIYYTEGEINAVRNANGWTALAADYSITAANGTWVDTGLYVTLPTAGTYLVFADVGFEIKFASGTSGYLEAKFYNSSDGADVANTERMLFQSTTVNERQRGTAPVSAVVTVGAPKTIKLYALRGNATSWNDSNIKGDGYGRTAMGYVRLK